MAQDKKNNSLLFQIYNKYKTAKSQIKEDPDAPIPEVMELVSEAVSVVSAATEPVPTEPEPVPPPQMISLPVSKKYLTPLYDLCCYLGAEKQNCKIPANVLDFEKELLYSIKDLPLFTQQEKVITQFLNELSIVASIMLSQLKKNAEKFEETPDGWAAEAEPLVADASVHLKPLANQMHALFIAFPPGPGGKELSEDDIYTALEDMKITSGIHQDLLTSIAAQGLYFQLLVIAEGRAPINGVDGYIEALVDCDEEVEIHQNDRGLADFKNLDTFHSIVKDQPICNIIPPAEGMDGENICGTLLHCKDGKAVTVPNGKNTCLSDDGTQLISMTDGHVSLKNKHYHVEPVLIIQENVDYSVGNIDFPGDVVIHGDVRSGFTVNAQGNIIVHGMAEGARLSASGDITLLKGMNGNYTGTIDAQGNVKSSFLENCTVFSGGQVLADTVVACDIFSEDSVCIQGSRGVIIGGSVTAYRSVEARIIGSKSRRETTIILGETPRLAAHRKAIQTDILESNATLEKLVLNFTYLNKLRGTLPPDKLSILNQLHEQKELYEKRIKDLNAELAKLIPEDEDYSQCQILCNMLFPVTKISIAEHYTVIDTMLSKCRIYLHKGDIQIGSMQ